MKISNYSHYSKFIVAVVGIGMIYLTQKYGRVQWLEYVAMALTALGVFQTPNTPKV
jgi:hypothetical protein